MPSSRAPRRDSPRGVHASQATGAANPTTWRRAFYVHAGADVLLTLPELRRALSEVRAAHALPEATLLTDADADDLLRRYDADGDGALSFDEYMDSRPSGSLTPLAARPVLPAGWAPHCSFGPAVRAALAGWTAAADGVLAPSTANGEWIACVTPSSEASMADVSVSWHFSTGGYTPPADDGTPSFETPPEAGYRVLEVANLPTLRGGITPGYDDVTFGWRSLVRDGALELTRAEPHTGGTAFFSLPPPHSGAPTPAFFHASFRVHVHDGTGGSGLSFSYGELTDHYVDEMGAGDGLRVLLRSGDVEQASLVYNQSTLRVVRLPSGQFRGGWRNVSLHFTPRGLTCMLGRSTLFADEPLPGFAPLPTWRLAIGARCGATDDAHHIDDVVFSRGASIFRGEASVQLSANGRDFTVPEITRYGSRTTVDGNNTSVLFEYYPSPIISSIDPPCGPLDGSTIVTVRGAGFDRSSGAVNSAAAVYRCQWGLCDCTRRVSCDDCPNVTAATWDAALNVLRCASPPWLGDVGRASVRREAVFRVSLNGVDFSSETSAAAPLFWRYSHPSPGAALLQMGPMRGPTTGGSVLRLRPVDGLVHGCHYSCRFGRAVVGAFRQAEGTDVPTEASSGARASGVSCTTPPQRAGGVSLFVSLNGQQYAPLTIAGEAYTYDTPHTLHSISPIGGPTGGGTRVVLQGNWSALPPAEGSPEVIRCRFGAEIVPGVREEATGHVACVAPMSPALSPRMGSDPTARGAGTGDGVDSSVAISEPFATTAGVANATVHPLGTWQLGESTRSGNPFYAEDTELRILEVGDVGERVALEVSFNGQDYSRAGVLWHWWQPPAVLTAWPNVGPPEGNTSVTLRVTGMWSTPHPQCRFGTVTVPGAVRAGRTHVDGKSWRTLEMTCITPSADELAMAGDLTAAAALASAVADTLEQPYGFAVPILVSQNGQDFVDDGFRFGYYESPAARRLAIRASAVRPLLGPSLGGTLVTLPDAPLRGASLPSHDGTAEYVCRIGGAGGQLVVAQLTERMPALSSTAHEAGGGDGGGRVSDADEQLVCPMPSMPSIGAAMIELTANGQQYAPLGHSNFTFHSPMLVTGAVPLTGPTAGGTNLLMRLENVSLTARQLVALLDPHYVCRFDETWQVCAGTRPPCRTQRQSGAEHARVVLLTPPRLLRVFVCHAACRARPAFSAALGRGGKCHACRGEQRISRRRRGSLRAGRDPRGVLRGRCGLRRRAVRCTPHPTHDPMRRAAAGSAG